MKPLFYSLTALAAVTLAAPAFAQSSSAAPAESSGASTGAMQAPASQDSMTRNASGSGRSSDQYWGVDTAGVREDVKAPYGGRNQAQADRKEAPVTDHLNEMQLQSNGQAQPR